MKRRDFLKALGAAGLVLFHNPLATAATIPVRRPKLVWLILRGGLDSLHTLVPTFDPQWQQLRPTLAPKINKQLLMLDQGYGLHPALKNLHQWYLQKELLPVAAVSSGYSARSHFDGQDYLESGTTPVDHDSGWLGRAVNIKQHQSLAIARSAPISLRGAEKLNTWYPSKLKEASEDTYQALMKLYQDDELLSQRLTEGLNIQEMANIDTSGKRRGNFVELSKAAARLMTGPQGVDCAMLELGGWDTHNNQASRLNRQLALLDQGLAALKTGMGDSWQDTVVVVASEFGRTAKENGTGGTDHGTAGAMFFAGGAVQGGRVLGQWPGLKQQQLFEQRDLMPTSNTYGWLSALLGQHWQFTPAELTRTFGSNPETQSYGTQAYGTRLLRKV